jgi:hypothetical protein
MPVIPFNHVLSPWYHPTFNPNYSGLNRIGYGNDSGNGNDFLGERICVNRWRSDVTDSVAKCQIPSRNHFIEVANEPRLTR